MGWSGLRGGLVVEERESRVESQRIRVYSRADVNRYRRASRRQLLLQLFVASVATDSSRTGCLMNVRYSR